MTWIRREIFMPAPESFGVVEEWHRRFNKHLRAEYNIDHQYGFFESRPWLVIKDVEVATYAVTHKKTGESYLFKESIDAEFGPNGNTYVRDDYLVELFSTNEDIIQLDERARELEKLFETVGNEKEND